MRPLFPFVALVTVACSCMSNGEHASGPRPADASGLSSAGAARDAGAAVSRTVVLMPPGKPAARVHVTLARTDVEREHGLMYVQNLPLDDGMLFLFDHEEVQSFWMKNTLIALDMIFIRSDLTVAGVVANAQPLTTTPRQVDKPSQYVLEVNGGWAAQHGVGAGTPVKFEGFKP